MSFLIGFVRTAMELTNYCLAVLVDDYDHAKADMGASVYAGIHHSDILLQQHRLQLEPLQLGSTQRIIFQCTLERSSSMG